MCTCRALFALALASGCASAERPSDHQHPSGEMPHRFDDVERWSAVWDAPERDAWQHPDLVVTRLVFRPDMRIVDLGAGTGYFSLRFARAVPNGEVIAVDVEPALLSHLETRARAAKLSNVKAWLARPDDPDLGDWRGTVDLVFVCNTYHHLADRPAYFARLANMLGPSGRIAVVDYDLGSSRGPPRDHKIPRERVVAEMEEAGLVMIGDLRELPEQYFLEFQKK